MKVNFPYNRNLLELNSIFNTNNSDNLRIVGGAVRNFILGKEISDFDLSCIFTPNKIIQILSENNIKYVLNGVKFGTVIAIIDNKPYEITSTREDIKTDGRHAVVKYISDFQIDAGRRDFTFNALYLDFHNNIYDYFNGLDDLKRGIVKFVGDPQLRIKEDYLRILRFFRFYCYYGTVLDNDGLRFSVAYKDALKTLSGERIRSEMLKILAANCPIQTLKVMEKNNILQLVTNLKEFDFEKLEILYSLKQFLKTEFNLALVLSLLLTKIDDISILQKMWKLSNSEFNKITYLFNHKNDKVYNESDIKKILFLSKSKENIFDLIILNGVINLKNINDINSQIIIIKQFQIPKLPINGDDLRNSGFLDNRKYKNIINKANDIFIESNFSLDKNQILKEVTNKND
jgi:poly(A) polymerase